MPAPPRRHDRFLSTLSLRRATWRSQKGSSVLCISIHALLAESDLDRWLAGLKGTLFLSTLSLRRATPRACRVWSPRRYFYPRSPCGERHPDGSSVQGPGDFYPRSPCGERPEKQAREDADTQLFLSTLSLRRATAAPSMKFPSVGDFYPRSPCGERP